MIDYHMVEPIREAFETIYREDRWSHGSGPGSRPENTIEYRSLVERFIVENDVQTVTDLGCGDWQSSRYIDWSGVNYIGLDVVPSVVESNASRYSAPNIMFSVVEKLGVLPGGDLVLAKEVLQHLPNCLVRAYLEEMRRKYRFALITNAVAPAGLVNTEVQAGGWGPLRLDRDPFRVSGATVFTYHPRAGDHLWRNSIFLLCGGG